MLQRAELAGGWSKYKHVLFIPGHSSGGASNYVHVKWPMSRTFADKPSLRMPHCWGRTFFRGGARRVTEFGWDLGKIWGLVTVCIPLLITHGRMQWQGVVWYLERLLNSFVTILFSDSHPTVDFWWKSFSLFFTSDAVPCPVGMVIVDCCSRAKRKVFSSNQRWLKLAWCN